MRGIFGFTVSVVAAILMSASFGFAASPSSTTSAVTIADGQNAITLVADRSLDSQSFNTCFHTLTSTDCFTVATGKRLVVESISALVRVPSPETLASVTIRSGPDPGTGDKETINYLQPGPAQPYTESGVTYNLYTIDLRQVRIYVSAGDSLSFLVTRSTNPGTIWRHSATLTGYLIPCTAGSANTCP